MSNIELNAILYYADYLSLQHTSIPLTDSPTYYFIYKCPINVAFITDSKPVYDPANKWFIKAKNDYNAIKNKFSEDAVTSFIEDICNIQACGVVNWKRMLQYIHQFSSNKERKHAFDTCEEYLKTKRYKHEIVDDNGDPKEEKCNKYVYHAENSSN